MKQNLLNFFFIIAVTFCSLAQVAYGPQVFEQCDEDGDGVAEFNLSILDAQILENQAAEDFTVSYFYTQIDADVNSNPLPIFYTNTTNPETIFARVTDNNSGNYDTTTVDLILFQSTDAGTDGYIEICENESPIDLFNVLGGSPQMGGIWSPSLASGTGIFSPGIDAPGAYTYIVATPNCFSNATVIVSVNSLSNLYLNDASFCLGGSVMLDTYLSNGSNSFVWSYDGVIIPGEAQSSLLVNETGVYSVTVTDLMGCGSVTAESQVTETSQPNIVQPTPLEGCDDDNDGFAIFTLEDANAQILNGQTNLTITYHETTIDAANGTNAIASPYINIVQSVQTIFVRVSDFNSNSNCSVITTLDILAGECTEPQNVLITDNTHTVTELISDVLLGGDCSQIFNLSYSTGTTFSPNEPNGIGYFTNESDLFPFEEGIVMSTGHSTSGSGPNSSNASNGSSNWPGDSDLDATLGVDTNNATVIEFDFIPVTNEISFDFLMASEEYDGGNFECSFSDAFAFLLTDANGVTTNLAVIPGTETPILVTNIHPASGSCGAINEEYFGGYTPNDEGPIGYNGRTVVFNAQSQVNIGEPYHLKMVIADDGDSSYDSAVFFNAASLDIGEICDDIGLINVKAYTDANSNGTLDSNETDFTNGFFTYEKNNDGVINYVNTSIGNFSIISTDETDSYDISFNVYDDYLGCYNVATTTINDISVANGAIITENFAVTDLQTCEDVAVYVINNFNSPRPGFDHSNLLILENLSSFPISSGTIEFVLDDALTINNVPNLNPNYTMTTTASGFTIDFVNLEAGASEIIEVSLNCPAVVALGQVVTNTLTYTTSGNDIFTENNTSQLSEAVIGSYDPNDKMESHGKDIMFDDFAASDEYLYYTIRFQNVGTAEAINVRIEDVLDAQLDESTFQMLRSSHDYVVTRTDNNLEWKFDNINLPAEQDDAEGSNGFVYFKIKPNAGYAVGDIIENSAAIYFDFNAPIITNTYQSEFVETLSVATYDDANFTLFPNPAKGEVTIQLANSNFETGKITIFAIHGKMILKDIKVEEHTLILDISNLESGLYFVELNIGNASTIQKLIVN